MRAGPAVFAVLLLLAACPPVRAAGLVPEGFEVPRRVEGEGFVVVPLGPELAQIDYEAYMSSIEHLQQTFTRSTAWPTAELDAVVRLRVTRAEFESGFDAELEAWARAWVAHARPFDRVACPGRSIDRARWDALPAVDVADVEGD